MRYALILVLSLAVAALGAPQLRAEVINVPDPDNGIYTIQDGINAASTGDEVVVAAGSYEAIVLSSAITVRSSAGPAETAIRGGFMNPAVILSGESVLRGFTVTGAVSAGGIWVRAGSPVIEENIIENNPGWSGINGTDASPVIRYNIIRKNSVFSIANDTVSGGGIRLSGEGITPQIYNNFIEDNQAICALCIFGDGGGVSVDGGTPRIIGNVFSGNVIDGIWGSAVVVSSTEGAVIANNTFYDNEGPYYSDPDLQDFGGTVAVLLDPLVLVANNIFQDNQGKGVACFPGTGGTIRANSFFDNTEEAYVNCPASTGDLFADAEMVDPANGDYHLADTSPLIDAGTSGLPGLPSKDVYGEGRFSDGDGNGSVVVDIGADEFNPSNPWGVASAQAGTTLCCEPGRQGSVAANYLVALLLPLGPGTIWGILRRRGSRRNVRRVWECGQCLQGHGQLSCHRTDLN